MAFWLYCLKFERKDNVKENVYLLFFGDGDGWMVDYSWGKILRGKT